MQMNVHVEFNKVTNERYCLKVLLHTTNVVDPICHELITSARGMLTSVRGA